MLRGNIWILINICLYLKLAWVWPSRGIIPELNKLCMLSILVDCRHNILQSREIYIRICILEAERALSRLRILEWKHICYCESCARNIIEESLVKWSVHYLGSTAWVLEQESDSEDLRIAVRKLGLLIK